jgi:hypothetical protein
MPFHDAFLYAFRMAAARLSDGLRCVLMLVDCGVNGALRRAWLSATHLDAIRGILRCPAVATPSTSNRACVL